MGSPIIIGLCAGLCSALLFAATGGGTGLPGLVLSQLTPLPLLIAGLGWGPVAVLSAGSAALVVVGLVVGAQFALVHAVAMALPAATICWLAHLRRPAPATATPATLEWYPPGRLLAWIAVMAGLLALGFLLVVGPDLDTIAKMMRALLERQVKAWTRAGGRELSEDDLVSITGFLVRVVPGAAAMSWMFMMLLNVWLAGRILRTSGRLMRPWPRLQAIELPPRLGLGLAAAVALSFGSGLPALAAGGFAAAFFMAYAVLGFAVLHWITWGRSSRGVVLSAVYASAILFAPYGTVPVALLGLFEPLARLRRRSPGPPPPPAPPGGPPATV